MCAKSTCVVNIPRHYGTRVASSFPFLFNPASVSTPLNVDTCSVTLSTIDLSSLISSIRFFLRLPTLSSLLDPLKVSTVVWGSSSCILSSVSSICVYEHV